MSFEWRMVETSGEQWWRLPGKFKRTPGEMGVDVPFVINPSYVLGYGVIREGGRQWVRIFLSQALDEDVAVDVGGEEVIEDILISTGQEDLLTEEPSENDGLGL